MAQAQGWRVIAAGWGFAEAVCFFIVPDVFTSRLVLRRGRDGFLACFYCLAGALAGGLLLYLVGTDSSWRLHTLKLLQYLPGIGPALTEKARLGLEAQGAWALFTGVMAGIPYKLYALQAPAARLPLHVFLATSVAARLSRFLLVTGLSWLLGETVFRKLIGTYKLRIHATAWTAFYLVYFWRMSG